MNRGSIGQADLRREVGELTTLMREDSDFADIRKILTAKDVAPADTLLAGLISGDDGSQYGVLIVRSGRCLLFETDSCGVRIRWENVDDLSVLVDGFDAVAVGVEMMLADNSI
ncbi:hypothetical protein [Micromonospora avicenniae]|uniref:hypothetical protein n=1 Tax=Micromonospora avicenniae TaxID=1198245 RepID=UPI003425430F